MKSQPIAELIILGGCKGVGKTSLAKEYCSQAGATYKHPGDWFDTYLHIIDNQQIEYLAVQDALAAPPPVLLDLHYSVYVKPFGWVRGLGDDGLKIVGQHYSSVALYLMESDVQAVYLRRVGDVHNKKRRLEKEIIVEDLRRNEEAFWHFVQALAPHTRVTAQKIVHRTLEESVRKLLGE